MNASGKPHTAAAADPASSLSPSGVEAAQQRLFDLLRIPSVSTDPAYAEHIQTAARWVAEHLRGSGLHAKVCVTDGHPVVLAHTHDVQVEAPDAPRVLFYGHYDVQPPDPVDAWDSPPCEPAVREAPGPNGEPEPSVFARGANDDKGQCMCFLEALRAYHDAGQKLPGPVTVMIEGEEECGSVGIDDFLNRHHEQLIADVALVSDTAALDDGRVTITFGLRGLAGVRMLTSGYPFGESDFSSARLNRQAAAISSVAARAVG